MIKENKEYVKLNIIQRKKTTKPKTIIALDTNSDGYVSLKEFMSAYKSFGPNEYQKGLFKHYAQGSLSYYFIYLLIKTNHPIISKIVCLPNLNYCIYS